MYVAVKGGRPCACRISPVRSRMASAVRRAFFSASMPMMTMLPAQRKPSSCVADTL